jgi:hypothetical protein
MLQLQRQVKSRLVIHLKRRMPSVPCTTICAQNFVLLYLHAYLLRISKVRLHLAAIIKFQHKAEVRRFTQMNGKQSHQLPQIRRFTRMNGKQPHQLPQNQCLKNVP